MGKFQKLSVLWLVFHASPLGGDRVGHASREAMLPDEIMRIYKDLFRQVRRAVAAAGLFSGLISLALLAGPLYALQLFEQIIPHYNLQALMVLGLVAVAAVAVVFLLDAVRGLVLLRAAAWLDHVPGRLIFEGGLKRAGQMRDIEDDAAALRRLRNFLTSATMTSILDILWVPLFFAGLFYIHPAMALVALAAAALITIGSLRHTKGSRVARAGMKDAQASRQDFACEVMRQGALARALGLSGGLGATWETFSRAHVASFYRNGKGTLNLRALSNSVRGLSEVVLLGLGALLVMGGQITPGALVAAMMLGLRALAPMHRIAQSAPEFIAARAAFARLRRLSNMPILPQSDVGSAAKAQGALQLTNVAVSYRGRKRPALHEVDLDLKGGECLIIAGPAGSGKTTLAAVIAGAVDVSAGSVTLDGVNPCEWQIAGHADVLGYAPDQPMILSGTVQQNITRFRDHCLMSAAHAAMRGGVHDLLMGLAQGYETEVGNGGLALSLREQRAVSLARAVHGKPALIVLDAPDAGLSGGEVRRLVRSLAALRADGTALVIATQNSQVQALGDKVVLLEGGRVAARGTVEELLGAGDDEKARIEPWRDPSAMLSRYKERTNAA